jgi:hypothetical protein
MSLAHRMLRFSSRFGGALGQPRNPERTTDFSGLRSAGRRHLRAASMRDDALGANQISRDWEIVFAFAAALLLLIGALA